MIDLDNPLWIVAILVLILAALFGGWESYEHRHPCLKYGPEYQYMIYQQIGNVWVPITGTTRDCLERE